MTAAPLRPTDPRTVGPFLLTGRIGSGGSGTVFAGLDAAGTRVAVKVLRPNLLDGPDGATLRARTVREVEALRRAPVHGVARLVAADLDSPQPWLATELLHGPTLHDRVAAYGPLPTDQLHRTARDLLVTLAGLHAAGVVHRDLKPANVVLASGASGAPGAAVLLDFGIADVTGAAPVTEAGAAVGSPGWMAPEQATGRSVGPAADLWNWGMLVAFAATGRPPFGTGRPDALVYRMLHEAPDLAGVPATVLPVVVAGLQRDPRARPTATTALAWIDRADRAGLADRAVAGRRPAAHVASPPDDHRGWMPGRRPAPVGMVPSPSTTLTPAVAPTLAPAVHTTGSRAPGPAPTAVFPATAAPVGAGRSAHRRRWRLGLAAVAAVAVLAGGFVTARSAGLLGVDRAPATPRQHAAELVHALDASRVTVGSDRSEQGAVVAWRPSDGPRPDGWVGSVEFRVPDHDTARVHVFTTASSASAWLAGRPQAHGPFSHTTVDGVSASRAYSVGFSGVTSTTTLRTGRTVVVARSTHQGFTSSLLDGFSGSDRATDLAAATARTVRSAG